MRKIFTLFCMMLFMAHTAMAQKDLFVVSKAGTLSMYSAAKMAFDDDLLTFRYGTVTEVTEMSFTSSFSVAFTSADCKSFAQTPKVGICFSDVNATPTIMDGAMVKGTSLGKYTFSIAGLDAGTTYYYRAFVKAGDAVYYGDVHEETTYGNNPSAAYTVINGHKFVDLGLPSGLLWATSNVGAGVAADAGNFYAWGETTPKADCSWPTYKYGASYADLTKYNATDGKTSLDPEDDAAYTNWGTSCRMPNNDDFVELCDSDNCTWTEASMTSSTGSTVSGYQFVSKKNGRSIFLPITGIRVSAATTNSVYCYYWSATRYSEEPGKAYHLNLYPSGYSLWDSDRVYGYPVRAVAKQ